MPERRKITTAEWTALANWYREKTGQELPQRLLGGYIREDDPIYQEFIAAKRPGYTPPQYSADWYATTGRDLFTRKPSWLPAAQGGETPLSAPVTPAISREEQAILDMEARQRQATQEERDWTANQATIADARLRYREFADWQRRTALNEQNIAANAQQFAWDTAQQRFAAKDVGLQSQNRELQRQVNEMQFERDRANLLAGISVNVGGRVVPGLERNDWITEYIYKLPNPYQKQEASPIDQLEANLDNLTGTIQKYEGEAVLAANAEAAGERYHITSEEAQSVVTDLQGRRESLEKTWKTVQDESRGWSPQPVPQPYPSAPGWLPQYAPGLQAGQMITRQNVPTPSGQQLTAMSRDQLEQLGYYGKWAGGLTGKYPWEQLTEAANLMQPRTPGGAGRFGWTPSRQV